MSDFSDGDEPARPAPGPPTPALDARPGPPDPDRGHVRDAALGPEVATSGPEVATSLESLESRICAGAARIAATTSQWLRLLVEFDRREGWRASGCRSSAQWLSWRCGMSLAAAYEHLRVGRALEGLPRIAVEFAAGRLSYSKVRALTRIAAAGEQAGEADPAFSGIRAVPPSPASKGAPAGSDEAASVDPATASGAGPASTADQREEAELLVLARSSTAAQLDRIAHGCRTARSLQAAQHRAMRRELRWWYADDGSLVIRGRLAPEEGRVVVAALEAAMDTLLKSTAAGDGAADDERGSDDERGGDDDALDEPAGDNDDSDSEDSDNDSSTDSSAEGSSGPDQACAEGETPGGRRASHEARCSSAVALRLHPRRRAALAADALVLLAETQLAHAPGFVNGGDKYRVIVHVDAASLAATTDLPEGGDSRRSPADQSGLSLDDGPPIHPQTARRLACETAVLGLLRDVTGEILDVGDATRFRPRRPPVRCASATAAPVPHRGVAPGTACRFTTRSTGRTVESPAYAISSCCAGSTTGSCTRAGSP
ncbi:hypothetical protein [Actinopolymorpha pittospori]